MVPKILPKIKLTRPCGKHRIGQIAPQRPRTQEAPMLRSLWLWLKYWLVIPGCTSFYPRQSLSHIIVVAFGRHRIPERSLHLIGQLAQEHRRGEQYQLCRKLRQGGTDVGPIDPGLANIALAQLAMKAFDSCRLFPQLWLQWEVAIAIPEAWMTQRQGLIHIIWPSANEGAHLDLNDVLGVVYHGLEHLSDDLPHTGILAHQGVIVRAMCIWQKMTGALPIIPSQDISGFLPGSILPWTRSPWAWYRYEAKQRLQDALRGRV